MWKKTFINVYKGACAKIDEKLSLCRKKAEILEVKKKTLFLKKFDSI